MWEWHLSYVLPIHTGTLAEFYNMCIETFVSCLIITETRGLDTFMNACNIYRYVSQVQWYKSPSKQVREYLLPAYI